MKQQTAMRDLIEWLRNMTWGFEEPCEEGRAEIDPIKIYNKAIELLKKEEEQIKQAYGDGLNAHRTNFCNRDQYFNLTYNNQ